MQFNFIIKSRNDYFLFVDYLKSVSKNETIEDKQRHINILNTSQNVIAIPMSNIRNIAKKIFKNGYEFYLNYSLKKNYKEEFYEDTLIQGLVIAQLKDFNKQKNYLNKWIFKIDNWATCDSVVSTMKHLKNNLLKPLEFEYFLSLCYRKEEFVSRFGIVTLMTYFLEEKYIDKILEMCKNLNSDYYYVKMALAWLLSFAFIKFKNKIYELLKIKVLDKFVQNKTICKCRDSFQVLKEDKELLIKYRKK